MEAKPKVLIIEDDRDIREAFPSALGENFETFLAEDGLEGIKAAIRNPPDLILLDIMMPNLDGFQTCRALRKDKVTADVPIIMVTALKDTAERVQAFKAGADDYLSKPFDIDELHARIEAKLRRFRGGRTSSEGKLVCGNLMIDLQSCEIRLDGDAVRMSMQEFKLVRYLVENKGVLLSRQQIISDVWDNPDASVRTLDTYVLSIRRKLTGFDHVIASVYNGGYILRSPNESSDRGGKKQEIASQV